jgi:UDP-2,3-diacylglucosamine pyrophosphatase LpxH
MSIVIVSDTHLGYSNSNSQAFESFLDWMSQRNDVESFVILGDFIDMWRRDASGLFLEFNNITQKIISMMQKMQVYCVAGNHDYHLIKLEDHGYPLQFQKDLSLQVDGITYRFYHGWEFDMAQQPPVMELLCRNFSDEGGQLRSDAWNELKNMGKEILDPLKDLFDKHKGGDKYIQHLLLGPNDRLGNNLSEVEKRAFENIKNGEILVFGHTHRPFVSSQGNLANSGSWLSDENTNNTYIEIAGRNVKLMQYGIGDITINFLRTF